MTKPSENYLSLAVIHCKYSLIYNLYLPAGESRKRAKLLCTLRQRGGKRMREEERGRKEGGKEKRKEGSREEGKKD